MREQLLMLLCWLGGDDGEVGALFGCIAVLCMVMAGIAIWEDWRMRTWQRPSNPRNPRK